MQEWISSPYLPFVLENYIEKEDTSTSGSAAVPSLSENVKSRLQLLIPLLELDTATLAQDAGAIRDIFSSIKDELPSQLKEVLKPAAFIEYHEPKFSGAQSRLAARVAQKNLPIQEKQCISSMLELKRSIDQLNGSPAGINQKLTALREEKEQLLSRLKAVEASINGKDSNSTERAKTGNGRLQI